jgi:hypothetical protein
MTKRIPQTIELGENKAGPGEFQIRLASGESVSFRRDIPGGGRVSYEVELSVEECAQLEGEGYSIKPGLSAYRTKSKAKPKKKIGSVVKDIAAPTNQEEPK